MADVFISYSRKDRDFVRRLHEALSRRKRDVWTDWEDIRPTEEFMQIIFGAIDGADTFIFVLTPDSVASATCGREIAHAAANHKRMVPILARKVDASAVPEALAKLHWISSLDTDDFEKATETLIEALDTDLDWVHTHTRLLTRAIEWEAKGKNDSFVLRGDDLRDAEKWLTEAGASKERQPTPLQTGYIIASRKAESRRQRITLGAVTVGFVIAIALGVIALFARQDAMKQQGIADEQRGKAVAQEKFANVSADRAKRTSVQADYELALLNRQPSGELDPRALAHLARALRTNANAALPRSYLVSLLRDRCWFLPITEPLRHEGAITSACFSPDRRQVVTASYDNTAQVWDAQSGQPVGGPLRHKKAVLAANFCPDGFRVVTASRDNAVRVWDLRTGYQVGAPMRHKVAIGEEDEADEDDELDDEAREPVVFASFSADGRQVVTFKGPTSRLWDAETGRPLGGPRPRETADLSARSPTEGRQSLTASEDKIVWPTQGQESIVAASFGAETHRIVIASWDQTARVWEAEPVCEPLRFEHGMLSPTFSADARLVVAASADNDNIAQVRNAQSGHPVGMPLQHEDTILSASFSGDGSHVATASSDSTARVWDAQTGRSVLEPLRHEDRVVSARFSADGRCLVAASQDNTARVWDLQSGQPLGEPMRHELGVKTASFSPDGRRVLTTSEAGTARIWDALSGLPLGKPIPATESFSADGGRVITTIGAAAEVWDAQRGLRLSEPMRHGDVIHTAKFNADGRRVVTASEDRTARVWDAQRGLPLGEAMRHEYAVAAASFSADGRQVVTASRDNNARVWDAQSGKPVSEPMRHEHAVTTANFSPDGRWVVTASWDETARVWDAQSGKPVSEPMRHGDIVEAANFSADGRHVVTMSGRSLFSKKKQTTQAWEVAVDLDSPLPAWVPELAEALARQRFDDNGLLVPPKKSIAELRKELLALKGDDFWSRFGRWFFMRGPERTISPDSRMSVGELERLRAEQSKLSPEPADSTVNPR